MCSTVESPRAKNAFSRASAARTWPAPEVAESNNTRGLPLFMDRKLNRLTDGLLRPSVSLFNFLSMNNGKPRVLLLSARSGAGHVRAAEALEKAFLARGDSTVEHIDALDYVSKLFERAYDKAYLAMVRRAPEWMGVLYERTDQPWRHLRPRLALDRLNTGPMIRLLKRVQPDLCVATHFLPAEMIAWLIAKKKLRARNAIVVTDYDVHALWLCRAVDRYYLAIEEAAEYLAHIGVRREKLRVTGIPIDPLFAVPLPRAEARGHLRLDEEATVILISAGGYGLGPIEQLVRGLLELQRPWQIVAIAGKAEKTR